MDILIIKIMGMAFLHTKGCGNAPFISVQTTWDERLLPARGSSCQYADDLWGHQNGST